MPSGWPSGVGRRVLEDVDSTNAEAARIVSGLSGPCWVLAGFQTEGRGRRGRAWVSPRGNFHATLVERPSGPPARIALRSFAAALSLRDALNAVVGVPETLALKWPNDVLLNGGKVAGILLESLAESTGVAHLAVGIGVNLIAAPEPDQVEPGAVPPVSVLAETGVRVSPERLLNALAPAYSRWTARLDEEGFAPLRAEWLIHAARLGTMIRARTGTMERSGIFETIDDSGALVLATQSGRVAIPAAEVFF
jgi:BirA family transcriptional regulator, biotin operon repressor / biotin---[acetyl-CoA-carboxylase] ligase